MMFLLLMLMVEMCRRIAAEQRSRHFSVEFLLVKNCPLHTILNKYDSGVNNKDKSESVDNPIEA